MWLGFLRCPLFSRMSEGQGKGEEETFPTGPLASLNHSFLPDTNGGLSRTLKGAASLTAVRAGAVSRHERIRRRRRGRPLR